VGRYGYDQTQAAERWLDEHPPEAKVVARWIVDCLLDEDCPVDSLLIVSDSGQRRNVTRVPGTRIDVTWLEAAPFRTIKVLWIEEDEDLG
jgi:hypothetical protein